MDELASGIELDISGIADEEWPPAADGCDEELEEQAAAASASAATPTQPWKTGPGRGRPPDADSDMSKPPQVPAPADGHHRQTSSKTPLKTPR
jgi:hypothetical protein